MMISSVIVEDDAADDVDDNDDDDDDDGDDDGDDDSNAPRTRMTRMNLDDDDDGVHGRCCCWDPPGRRRRPASMCMCVYMYRDYRVIIYNWLNIIINVNNKLLMNSDINFVTIRFSDIIDNITNDLIILKDY